MAYIGSVQKCTTTGTGGTTNVTVTPTTFTAGIPKDISRIRITNSFTLPAGAMAVDIFPLDWGAANKITINGRDYFQGDRYSSEMQKDPTDNKVYYVEELVIVAKGQYNFRARFPESHPVDFTALGL